MSLDKRRKLFISYYHKDDEYYRNEFERMFGHLFINKSVKPGQINTDNGTEYIKRLLQTDYLNDTSVLIVLVGPNTYGRKYVDWEISSALSQKVGGRSGLLGLCLPTHQNYLEKNYTADIVPPRLVDNLITGYASLYDWTTDENIIKQRIENAIERKKYKSEQINNSRLQFKNNRSE